MACSEPGHHAVARVVDRGDVESGRQVLDDVVGAQRNRDHDTGRCRCIRRARADTQ